MKSFVCFAVLLCASHAAAQPILAPGDPVRFVSGTQIVIGQLVEQRGATLLVAGGGGEVTFYNVELIGDLRALRPGLTLRQGILRGALAGGALTAGITLAFQIDCVVNPCKINIAPLVPIVLGPPLLLLGAGVGVLFSGPAWKPVEAAPVTATVGFVGAVPGVRLALRL